MLPLPALPITNGPLALLTKPGFDGQALLQLCHPDCGLLWAVCPACQGFFALRDIFETP